MGALIYWWIIEPAALIGLTFVLVVFSLRLTKRALSRRVVIGMAVAGGLLLWVFLPAWDNVLGREKFAGLCRTEAGVEVFKTIKLMKDQISPEGLPISYKLGSGVSAEKMFGTQYRYERKVQPIWVPEFSDARIQKQIESLHLAETNELLGQRTVIQFRPGGVPIIIAERRWLQCPAEKAGDGFGRALGRAIFQGQ